MDEATRRKKRQDIYKRANDRRGVARAIARAERKATFLAEPPPAAMTCTACAASKPLEAFAADKRARWGRMRTCKTCRAERTRSYVNASPERRAATLARVAAWNAAHPGVGNERTRQRRARLRGAPTVPFTTAQLDARMSMFGHRCWMCGGPFQHVDHVKPLAKGGSHMLCNLRPACVSCNARKRQTWPFHAIPMLTAKAMERPEPDVVHRALQ